MCTCNSNCESPCSCNQTYVGCVNNGCPVQLDFSCIIYNKDNNSLSELDGLGLSNGATLKLVIEAIDEKIKELNVVDWNLPHLRASYLVNNLGQFGEAVDAEFIDQQAQITALSILINVPLVTSDTNSIDITQSGTLGHTISADVKISGTVNNQLQILADGLFASAAVLAFDAGTKVLSVVGGNSVNISGAYTGWLGNVASDPGSTSDGQYWFRTDLPVTDGLRIKLNGLVRTIPTT